VPSVFIGRKRVKADTVMSGFRVGVFRQAGFKTSGSFRLSRPANHRAELFVVVKESAKPDSKPPGNFDERGKIGDMPVIFDSGN
jgi:hypothetical protein